MRITPLRTDGHAGLLGLGSCPGKSDADLSAIARRQLLESDIRVVRSWNAKALVSVLEDGELKALKVEDVGASATRVGIWWFRTPIKRGAAPDDRFWRAWPQAAPALLEILRHAQRVVVHSDTHDGRAGLVACCLLAELGLSANEALSTVRAADTVVTQSPVHELFIREYLPRFPEHTRMRSPRND